MLSISLIQERILLRFLLGFTEGAIAHQLQLDRSFVHSQMGLLRREFKVPNNVALFAKLRAGQ